jgi:flagellar hook-basal body complex protein FliE
MAISPIGQIPLPGPVNIAAPGQARPPEAFAAVFGDAVARVEDLRGQAAGAVERVLSGEGEELHTAVLATQKAELAFELFLQVRNKVVQAYQEIMRMPI